MERKPPQDTESRHADKYIVRFPDGMRDELKAIAKASGRTLNAEIVGRLQRSLETDQEVEQVAFEHGFERTTLQLEIERLNKLLEEQKTAVPQALQQHAQAIAAEVAKHLYSEAGETIEAARQAAEELKAAGKWPIKPAVKKKGL
ncbi:MULTISPECIES: Arc family DNA-binding protein [Delftia]|uniref:Arc family DNA-binding protein n=1 Tax=Delftia TaxID=80865 RepID=UPI0018788EB3|nr:MULTISPECIES: Arc family DNA-binding protein [Delftia]WEL95671.1 Arc family DNA-binding protein [Delftia tsuruhatensis]WQM80209.1 Arc family DNA-binding protein [Delftia tsuruhatensis]